MFTGSRSAARSRRSTSRGTVPRAHSARNQPSRGGQTQPRLTLVPPPTQPAASSNKVKRLSPRTSLPLWLRVLVRLQRSSLVVTFALVVAALFLYGSTVYTQQLWTREYNKLKTIQRHERQLIATGEMLKNQMAEQAERPASGLIPRTPAHLVFVPSASPRPAPPQHPLRPQPVPTGDAPLGY